MGTRTEYNGSSLYENLAGGEIGTQRVKNGLKFALGRISVNSDALYIILRKVEANVNLTNISSTPDEPFVFSPFHFLTGTLIPDNIDTTIKWNEITKMWGKRVHFIHKF